MKRFCIRFKDWTYHEIEAEQMIEFDNTLYFISTERGIIDFYSKDQIRIVSSITIEFKQSFKED